MMEKAQHPHPVSCSSRLPAYNPKEGIVRLMPFCLQLHYTMVAFHVYDFAPSGYV